MEITTLSLPIAVVSCTLLSPYTVLQLRQLQKEQMGASFPPKRQTTPEKPDRLAINRESEGIENGVRSTREMAAHLKPPVCY